MIENVCDLIVMSPVVRVLHCKLPGCSLNPTCSRVGWMFLLGDASWAHIQHLTCTKAKHNSHTLTGMLYFIWTIDDAFYSFIWLVISNPDKSYINSDCGEFVITHLNVVIDHLCCKISLSIFTLG